MGQHAETDFFLHKTYLRHKSEKKWSEASRAKEQQNSVSRPLNYKRKRKQRKKCKYSQLLFNLS